jgi:hypothetical protein
MFSLKKISLSYCLINFVLLMDNTLGLRQMLTNKQLRNRFPVTLGRLLSRLEPRVDGNDAERQVFVSHTLETGRSDHPREFLLRQNKGAISRCSSIPFSKLQQTQCRIKQLMTQTNLTMGQGEWRSLSLVYVFYYYGRWHNPLTLIMLCG